MIADILGIGTLLSHFVKWIEQGIIWVVNHFIISVADGIAAMIAILPNIPSAPSLSGGFMTWVEYGEYWFPVTYLIGLGLTLLTLYISYYLISIPLRWFKVVRGSE
jgi:hypothetical protein